MSDRDTSLPMPASGGSYLRDPETGALESCDYSLPVSQLIEVPGLTEETRCEAQMACLSAECSIDEFEEGVRLEVQLAAQLRRRFTQSRELLAHERGAIDD